MKEIIFWFSSHKTRNYWLDYAVDYLKRYIVPLKYNKIESWIDFLNLRILFKANTRGEMDLAGHWDKNQYWVEDLFDNEFKEFFFTIIFENKPFIEMSDILEEDING